MEEKDNSGALFKNIKKSSEKQPDYTGRVKVNGVSLNISAWLRTTSKGEKYMSLSFSTPMQRKEENSGNAPF